MVWTLLVACNGSSTTDTDPPPPTDRETGTDTDTTPTAETGTTVPHSGHTGTTAPTNILILLADDFGVDHVDAYHATDADIRTPVIDGLAAEGVLFENVWSYTACSPARAAMQTGRHARRTGFGANWAVGWPAYELSPDEVTLPEVVRHSTNAIWSDALVGKWHLVSDNAIDVEGSPHRQGWTWFQGMLGSTLSMTTYPGGPPGSYYEWRKTLDDESQVVSTTYATTDNVDDAIGRLGVLTEPWLMEVSFNAIHFPLQVPPDHLTTYEGLDKPTSYRLVAEAMGEALDTEIGRLLDAMPADVRARTTIVFLGDNGDDEATWEVPLPNERGAAPPNFAKGSLKDFGIRIPLIVAGPLVAHPGTRTEALASIVDLLPTVADIAGVDVATLTRPDGGAVHIDGMSLLPVLRDPTAPLHPTIYSERFTPLGPPGRTTFEERTIRDDRYKLWLNPLTGAEQFNEYVSGGIAEGPNLLPLSNLTPDQRAAYDRLKAEQEAYVQTMETER